MAKTRSLEESSRAFQVHLAEFESVRDEIIFLSDAQIHLISYTFAIVSGVITLFAIGISIENIQQSVVDQGSLIFLLAAFLISVLNFISLEAEMRIQALGRYIQYTLSPKMQRLVGNSTAFEYTVLKWEETRSRNTVNRIMIGGLTSAKYIAVYALSFFFTIIFYYLRPSVATWTNLEKALFSINVAMILILVIVLLTIALQDMSRGKKVS